MKKCPYCAEQIQNEAVICKYCKKKQPTILPYLTKELSQPLPNASRMLDLFKVVLIGCAVVAVGYGAIFLYNKLPKQDTSTQPKSSSTPRERNYAIYVAQEFVKEQLKAPSTAEFDSNYKIANISGTQYQLAGYVDAENSFGAKLRQHWSVIMTYNGGKELDKNNWTLNSIEVSN